MSEVATIEAKNLQKVEKLTPAIFEQKKITKLIKDVKREVLSLVPDATTDKGRKEVKSLAYKVARSKTTLDTMGKEHVATIKAEAKVVDDCRKLWRDAMDELKTEVLQPVTEYEEKEAARVEAIEQKIARIQDLSRADDGQGYFYTSSELQERKEQLMAIDVDESFQEYEEKAQAQWGYALKSLETLIAGAKAKEEQEAAEAKRMEEERRKAQEERDKRIREEAAEKARQEERDRAEKERQRQEQEVQRKKRLEEQEKAAEERAERQKREDEERRARNTQHRGKVNKAAMQALMKETGIDEPTAKAAVTAIVKGNIPNVTITY